MNRINQLFSTNPRNLLSIYFCAGCPTLEGTADVIRSLERNGVDMIEIGIPFSDPMADGIVIQEAATRALRNGMSLRLLFSQLEDIRRDVQIPLILMGSLASRPSAGDARSAASMGSSSPTSPSATMKRPTRPLPTASTCASSCSSRPRLRWSVSVR